MTTLNEACADETMTMTNVVICDIMTSFIYTLMSTIQSSTTWAMQNPSKDPQPAHIHLKRTLTSAEKITCNPRRKVLQDNNEEFQEDIALFQKEWDSKIQDLAKKHSKTVDGVHLLLTNATHYKKSCAPTLHNALIHYKSEEVNADESTKCSP